LRELGGLLLRFSLSENRNHCYGVYSQPVSMLPDEPALRHSDENALGLRPNALDPSRRDLAESGRMAPKGSPKGGQRGEKLWK
jgi:hypothetical protein